MKYRSFMSLQFSKWFFENAEPQLNFLLKLLSLKRFLSENYYGDISQYKEIIEIVFSKAIMAFANKISNSSNDEVIEQLGGYDEPITKIAALKKRINPDDITNLPQDKIEDLYAEKAIEECKNFKGNVSSFNFAWLLFSAVEENTNYMHDAIFLPIKEKYSTFLTLPADIGINTNTYIYSAFARGALNKAMLTTIISSNHTDMDSKSEAEKYWVRDMRQSFLRNIKNREKSKEVTGTDEKYFLKKTDTEKDREFSPSSFVLEISNEVINYIKNSKTFKNYILNSAEKSLFGNFVKSVGIDEIINVLTYFLDSLRDKKTKASIFLKEIITEKFGGVFKSQNEIDRVTKKLKDILFPVIDDIVKDMDDERNEKIENNEYVQMSKFKNIYQTIWQGMQEITGTEMEERLRQLRKKKKIKKIQTSQEEE